jgi:hypothetical protein
MHRSWSFRKSIKGTGSTLSAGNMLDHRWLSLPVDAVIVCWIPRDLQNHSATAIGVETKSSGDCSRADATWHGLAILIARVTFFAFSIEI